MLEKDQGQAHYNNCMAFLGNFAKAKFEILDSVRDRVQQIKESIYPTLKDVINANSDILKDIQNVNQLFTKGEDSKGSRIKPSYANVTISIKRRKRQPTDRVTLKDTGNFYESVTFEGVDNALVITASVEYASFLSKRYGKDILGIQDMEFQKFYDQYIEPELTNKIDNIIDEGI